MAFEDAVREVNAKLLKMHDEATRNHESPRLIELVDILIDFTDLDGTRENSKQQPTAEEIHAKKMADWQAQRPKL